MRRCASLFSVLGILGFGVSAQASLLTFTSEAAFQGAIGGAPLSLEGFNSIVPGAPQPGPLVFGALSVNTAAGTVSGTNIPQFVTEGTQTLLWNDVGIHGDITFSFAAPTNAFAIDIKGLGAPGGTTLSASIDGGSFFDVFVGATGSLADPARFVGFFDDSASFSSVTFSNSALNLVGVDRAQYGNVVPEPGTAALLLLGFGGLAGLRRRHN